MWFQCELITTKAPLHDIFPNCFKYSLKSAETVTERC
ncbi:hypothetical protein T11_5666 [Trichinella zimbabwensis]|uniref:Uncharacterized protein n=1 Tax=Trichinella zimbabwensis TaxID=268475 RepID=A0A0V1G212_9BILA|nr:hypothetical protein T11_16940 [Trichinella zimbabwensis]KRY94027.1 hypothetical protein T11_5666 [Trichinella zimbabwensis]